MADTVLTSDTAGIDSGVITINDASTYVLALSLLVRPRFRGKPLAIVGDVGSGGAIAHFKITWAVVPGGTHTTLFEDTGLNTLGNFLLFTTNNIYTTSASGSFTFVLHRIASELKFYAKKSSADTTLRLRGVSYSATND